MQDIYYKRIKIANLDIIVSKIKSFLEKENFINSTDKGYIPLEKISILLNCPEIFQSFSQLGFEIKGFAIYKTFKNDTPVHVDQSTYKARINIPILNCVGTHTIFYKADTVLPIQQDYKNLELIPCINEIEVDRITIDQPTVIRIDRPHRVLMNEQASPRICLTVRCEPDPILLFNKE